MIFVFMKLKITVILIIGFILIAGHPFYVSVMEVEYDPKSREVGISIKTFPDDMEETLRMSTGKKVDIGTNDKVTIGKLMDQYIQQHVSIAIDNQQKAMYYLGYEIDKEGLWMYFSIPSQKHFRNLEITSDLMYEYRPEQTNIIHMRIAGKEKSYRLTAPTKKIIFNYSAD